MAKTNEYPLVSIICSCKNRVQSIRRCVESVLAQDYPNIEFIVQDGASTDGTLEILKEYGSRIELVSEPDSGPGEGFVRALSRVTGVYFGSCLSDEELLPGAVSWGVDFLSKNPDYAAVYGDYYSTDIEGKITSANRAQPWNFERYLCCEIVPPFCSTFFRTAHFKSIGFDEYTEAGEYDIWLRLGVRYPVTYQPGFISKFASHDDAITCKVSDYYTLLPGRIRAIDRLVNDPASPPAIRELRDRAVAGLHLWYACSFFGLNAFDDFEIQIKESLRHEPNPNRLTLYVTLYINKLLETNAPAKALAFLEALSADYPAMQDLMEQKILVLCHMEKFAEAKSGLEHLLSLAATDGEKRELYGALLDTIMNRLSHDKVGIPERTDMKKEAYLPKFRHLIRSIADFENRLFYRDQTPESLYYLVEAVDSCKPTLVVELGTLAGLSLRTWLEADPRLKVIAVDLSFDTLRKTRDLIPLDLSRVTLLEQDIMRLDFGRLWGPSDRVLFYVDAHDLPGVPIMDHVLGTAAPALPPGSLIVVDDLWYSPDTLTGENAGRFFSTVVINEIDPLQCFEGHFASYWKGGSFMGFPEVIPLMEWVNRNRVELSFRPGIKSVTFQWAGIDRSLPAETVTGCFYHNPVSEFTVLGEADSPVATGALSLCRRGAGQFNEGDLAGAVRSFAEALSLTGEIRGANYAIGVSMARLGRPDTALDMLEAELRQRQPHPQAEALKRDILAWLAEHQACRSGTSEPGITIFSLPKPFTGNIATIQRNAIKSWINLAVKPEIILLGDDEGVAETAREFGLVHIPDIERSPFGTPLVSAIFERAQAQASCDLVAYVNTDIVLCDDFSASIRVLQSDDRPFLAVGRRWDLAVREEIDFSDPRWDTVLLDRARTDGMLHASSGIDYFIFRRGLYREIPPFAVGRTAWDNWLIWEARQRGAALLDATHAITAVHQEHDYNHSAGGVRAVWLGDEAKRNQQLAAGRIMTINDADLVLRGRGIVPRSAADILPEPTSGDYTNLKLNQALDAVDRGLHDEALDCLAYIEMNLEGCAPPKGFHLLQSHVLLKKGDTGTASAKLRKELEFFPDNRDALKLLAHLEKTAAAPTPAGPEKTASPTGAPAAVNRPEGKLRYLQVNTFYDQYLRDLYQRQAGLGALPYDRQVEAVLADGFSAIHNFVPGLRAMGHDAGFVVANCPELQAAWLRENGRNLPSEQDWVREVVRMQIEQYRPDALILSDCYLFDTPFLQRLSHRPAVVLGWTGEYIPDGVDWSGLDAILSNFYYSLMRAYAYGARATERFSPGFAPWLAEGLDRQEPEFDVVFVGQWTVLHHHRNALISALAREARHNRSFSLGLYINGDPRAMPDEVNALNRGGVFGLAMHRALRSGRIAMNFGLGKEFQEAGNMRLFETTGSGVFLLNEYMPNIHEYFEPGIEVGVFRGEREMLEKVAYYLAHPDERETIAENGRKRCLGEYSMECRVAELDAIIRKYLAKKRKNG